MRPSGSNFPLIYNSFNMQHVMGYGFGEGAGQVGTLAIEVCMENWMSFPLNSNLKSGTITITSSLNEWQSRYNSILPSISNSILTNHHSKKNPCLFNIIIKITLFIKLNKCLGVCLLLLLHIPLRAKLRDH